MSALSAGTLSDLPALAYGGALTRERLGQLVTVVIGVAQKGDAVAGSILEEAASELASAVRSCARKLDFLGGSYPLIFSGGLFKGFPPLVEMIVGKVELEGAIPLRLSRDPAEGALLMGLDLYRSLQGRRA